MFSRLFHINCTYRKPFNTRVQGVDCREWLFPSQNRQRCNRVLNGFPLGEARAATCGVAPSYDRITILARTRLAGDHSRHVYMCS